MICPKCGSNNVTSRVLTETTTTEKRKGFCWAKSCIGYFLFSVPGVLCGLCGMGKGKHTTRTTSGIVNVCQQCGNRF